MDEIYDLIGIGFGPANLTLGVCLEEEGEASSGRHLKWLFLEAKPQPVWHPGLLLESTSIQNSVLKDLALVRNPRSRFTFLNYLKEKGRLFEFLNLRDLYPTRVEFNDYLSWAASEMGERVRYGCAAVAVHAVAGNDGARVELLRVVAESSSGTEEFLTRNLVIATGGAPWVPPGVDLAPGGRAFHAHEFLSRLRRDFPDAEAPHRFVVVGQGQSAAELFLYLLTHYPRADVTAAIRHFAYKPVDVSEFTNEIFFPQMVDVVFDLGEKKRRLLLDTCRDVNYSVVDSGLIRRIYQFLYQEKVAGRSRARIHPFLELTGVEESPAAVTARFVDLLCDRPVALEADAAVLATGFEWRRAHPLLAEVAGYLEREGSCGYRTGRDYRIAAAPGFLPRIYVQGGAETTHGVSETVLSLMPIRAGDILRSILSATSDRRFPTESPRASPPPARAWARPLDGRELGVD